MRLTTPRKIGELQNKLYRKAKNEPASQGAVARHPSVPRGTGVWLYGRVPSARANRRRVREPAMKLVGKPDAGNPHVRFDERGLGNGTALCVSTRARPRLYRRSSRAASIMYRRILTRSERQASRRATDGPWRERLWRQKPRPARFFGFNCLPPRPLEAPLRSACTAQQ